MDALWPELAEQRRPFEVVVTVPRADGGEPLVPCKLPPEVLGCWSADQVTVSVTVLASRPSGAVAVAELLVPELAGAAGAEVRVRSSVGLSRALAHPVPRRFPLFDPALVPERIRDRLAVIGYWYCSADLRGKLDDWDALDQWDVPAVENDLDLMGSALAR
jgi:hypothetical protein